MATVKKNTTEKLPNGGMLIQATTKKKSKKKEQEVVPGKAFQLEYEINNSEPLISMAKKAMAIYKDLKEVKYFISSTYDQGSVKSIFVITDSEENAVKLTNQIDPKWLKKKNVNFREEFPDIVNIEERKTKNTSAMLLTSEDRSGWVASVCALAIEFHKRVKTENKKIYYVCKELNDSDDQVACVCFGLSTKKEKLEKHASKLVAIVYDSGVDIEE
jgi:hypothetical protein